MLTVVLQLLAALLTLAFGGVALAVARYRSALAPDRRAGWQLTGTGFSLLGASNLAQTLAGTAAFLAGPGSATLAAYLRCAPALNHSRSFLVVGLAALLGVLAWIGRDPSRAGWRRLNAALGAAMLLGLAMGWLEGPLDVRTHGPRAAAVFTVELVAFALALLLSAARGSFDVFLFGALSFYGLMAALGVPTLAGLSWGLPLTPAWLLPFQTVLFLLAMLGVAGLRLSLLRRGVRVREVFEAPVRRTRRPDA